MTPEQLLAVLQLLSDLRIQLGQALAENMALRQQLADVRASEVPNDVSGEHL